MTCKKCETICEISAMKGDGPIRPLPFWSLEEDEGFDAPRPFWSHRRQGASGHHYLQHRKHIDDGTPLGKWIWVAGKDIKFWYNDGTSDGLTIDPDTGRGVPPNSIGTITLESLADVDGKCPREYPGGEGDCYEVNSLKECDSTIQMSWKWDDSTQGNRYGMGITYGNWKFRDCNNPGPGDSAFSETADDYWKGLMTVPPASAAAREGSRKFSGTTCGHVFMWRIHFYDEHDGTDRAGIEDNYFEITVGCEGCCTKIQLEE